MMNLEPEVSEINRGRNVLLIWQVSIAAVYLRNHLLQISGVCIEPTSNIAPKSVGKLCEGGGKLCILQLGKKVLKKLPYYEVSCPMFLVSFKNLFQNLQVT